MMMGNDKLLILLRLVSRIFLQDDEGKKKKKKKVFEVFGVFLSFISCRTSCFSTILTSIEY